MRLKWLEVRLTYAFTRAKEEGIRWTLKEAIIRTGQWLGWLMLLPISLPLHIAGARRLPVLTQRIGHLAGEVDCFIKKLRLGQLNIDGKYFFLLAPKKAVANICLLNYWREYMTVIDHPFLCWVLGFMTHGPLMRIDIESYLLAFDRSAEYYSVQAQWGNKPALLQLSSDHQAIGEKFLSDCGVPSGAWFVCVHSRDQGYSIVDDAVHDYRNSTLINLIPAIQEIVTRGGWCIRMGDKSSEPLPVMDGVIDYAHHPWKSDELDIFFCARCRFFLGNTSGLFVVSSVFGVPVALANQTPFAATGFRVSDLSIPKRIKRVGSPYFLTSEEILGSPISHFRMSRFYVDSKIELIENSGDEILDLAIEMLGNLDGELKIPNELELYRCGFFNHLTPEHYCFGTASSIANSFLLRHKYMFEHVSTESNG
jgi:putative glycosyltransferase (TIGR04372 family)